MAEPSIGNILRLIYFGLRFQQILDTFPKQTLLALVIDDQQGDDDSNGDEKEFEHGVNSSSITSYLSFEF